jgi:hypothetical protein
LEELGETLLLFSDFFNRRFGGRSGRGAGGGIDRVSSV